MLEHQVTTRLADLSLGGMAKAVELQTTNSAFAEMAFVDRLGHIVTAEEDWRSDRRRDRLLRAARLRVDARPEDIAFSGDRGLDRVYVAELLTCQWIGKGDTLLITGPTGTGKTWLACAFGHQATRAGFSVRYFRTNSLLEEMSFAHADGSIRRLKLALGKVQLLILDDFALAPVDERAKQDLLDLLENRTGERATLVAGQRSYTEWHGYLENPHLSDAIMDRLVQRSHKLRLKGESLRKAG